MVGRDPSTFYQREKVPIGEVVFEARNVSGNGVTDVSFHLRRGEMLGIAGMAGSGRSELMEVLFGSARLDAGEILIDGQPLRQAVQPQGRPSGTGCASSPRTARTRACSCSRPSPRT